MSSTTRQKEQSLSEVGITQLSLGGYVIATEVKVVS